MPFMSTYGQSHCCKLLPCDRRGPTKQFVPCFLRSQLRKVWQSHRAGPWWYQCLPVDLEVSSSQKTELFSQSKVELGASSCACCHFMHLSNSESVASSCGDVRRGGLFIISAFIFSFANAEPRRFSCVSSVAFLGVPGIERATLVICDFCVCYFVWVQTTHTNV